MSAINSNFILKLGGFFTSDCATKINTSKAAGYNSSGIKPPQCYGLVSLNFIACKP